MPQLTRRNTLIAILTLVGLALVLLILLILSFAQYSIVNKTQDELRTGIRVFSRVLEDRNEQLASHVRLLAGDLRFQQAIAKHALTHNDAAILHWLQVHQNTTSADLSMLVDMQGRNLANAQSTEFGQTLVSALALHAHDEEVNFLINLDGRPYQMVFAPLQRGQWRAWVGMGFELDEAFLERVRSAAGMDVSILIKQGEQARWFSTLPPHLLSSAKAGNFAETLEAEGWQSLRTNFPAENGEIWSVVSTSVSDEYQAFATFRQLLLAAALLCLGLVVTGALWLRREMDHALQSFGSALQQLARDELGKPLIEAAKVPHWLRSTTAKFQRALQERERRFAFRVRHDPVTGLPNRQRVEALVRDKLSANQGRNSFLMILLQLRRLGQLRHIHGGDVSDEIVKMAASRAEALLASGDIIGRLEDDQLLLYFDTFHKEQLVALPQQILNLYRRPVIIDQLEFHLDVGIGAVLSFGRKLDYSDLVRRCRLALAAANNKQSHFELYRKGQDDLHLRRANISYSIPNALRDNEFTLVYQPQFNLKSSKVERVEALLRWHSSRLGILGPDEFIPLAERSGQIAEISGWLISAVANQLEHWRRAGLAFDVSINLSAHDLLHEEVIQHLTRSFDLAAVPASRITLEVTESSMIQQLDAAVHSLRHLHEQGFKLAMDDFGTGFSSLSQIKSLPVQEVKIDRSFVQHLDRDREDRGIVSAAIQMAHTLGLEVIAEGVENSRSLEVLYSLGCDAVQGNYLACPMSSSELEKWIAAVTTQYKRGLLIEASTGRLQQRFG